MSLPEPAARRAGRKAAKERAPYAVAAVIALLALGLFGWGDWAEIPFVVAVGALPGVLLLLGESRRGGAGRVVLAAALTAVLLVGGFLLLIALSGEFSEQRTILGLPLPMAIQIYGMTLAPLLVIGLLFALDFDRYRVDRRDLTYIRSLSDDRS